MSETLPPYSEAAATVQSSLMSEKPTQSIPQQAPLRFPKAFGIYHASGSHSDLVIALRNHDPNPLFYVETHSGLSSKPSIIFRSTGSSFSPQLATADFSSFSSTTDICLFSPSPVTQGVMPTPTHRTKLEKSRSFTTSKIFSMAIAGGQTPEEFEWKRSQGAEVRSLNGRSHGMKLVRCKTGEVVAAWAPPSSGTRKRGKMAFLGNREMFGERFEVMAVVSMLAIMERTRRSGNGAAAGAAGGAAAGGGGGC